MGRHPPRVPHPEVCRPEAGASKDALQRCSLHCSISGTPALSFGAPAGHLGMMLSWILALAARKIIERTVDCNRGNSRAAAHSDGAHSQVRKPKGVQPRRARRNAASCNSPDGGTPASAFEPPMGHLMMGLSGISALACRIIGRTDDDNRGESRAEAPSDEPYPKVRKPTLCRRRTRSHVAPCLDLSAADNGCCGQPFRYAISRVALRQLSRWPQNEPMP